MKLPLDVRALYDQGRKLAEERARPVRLAVLVEIDAPDELVETARAMLHPATANAQVDVAAVEPGYTLKVGSRADAVIVLVGSGKHVVESLRGLREAAIPTLVVALRSESATLSRLVDHPANDVVAAPDASELMQGDVAEWLVSRLDTKRQALGHNFEFMRRVVAKEIVKATAWQNAAIGVVMFIPGADMPIMTLNQGKMLLQIAGVYGQPLDSERIKELAVVVGGGFALRTFARELVGMVPGFGWAIKGSVAYTGTVAMGMAAIKYFEEGVDLNQIARTLRDRAKETAAWAAGRIAASRERHPLEVDLDMVGHQLPPADGPTAVHAAGYTAAAPRQDALIDVPAQVPTLEPSPGDRTQRATTAERATDAETGPGAVTAP